jgi:hypothetical protein
MMIVFWSLWNIEGKEWSERVEEKEKKNEGEEEWGRRRVKREGRKQKVLQRVGSKSW